MHSCLGGFAEGPPKSSCTDWFFYHCYTVGDGKYCSNNIPVSEKKKKVLTEAETGSGNPVSWYLGIKTLNFNQCHGIFVQSALFGYRLWTVKVTSATSGMEKQLQEHVKSART